ncbi:MAG: hypothetical protein K0R63_720 [Rickettsiales bacterium]|jgi:hypothetical protein|nr:hypothetical protein [Rickettsiales bacterium]
MLEQVMPRVPLVIALVACVFMLSACTKGRFNPFWAKPYSFEMRNPPPGPPEYQQGYMDGCESGYKGYGTQYNKVWWELRQDPKYRNNPMYYQMWKDAYAYCAAAANSMAMHGVGNYSNDGWIPMQP